MRARKQTYRGGGEVSKPAVWPLALVVVVDAPRLDRARRVVEAVKPAPVQTFRAERAVEALDEHILRRLPRMDEFQPHAVRACREAEEIHAPAFVRLSRSGHRPPRHQDAAAGLSATRLQSCFLIHALHALVVDAVGIAIVAASVVAAVQAVG